MLLKVCVAPRPVGWMPPHPHVSLVLHIDARLTVTQVIDRNTDNIVDQTKGDSLGDLSFKLDGLRTRNRVPYENVDLDMVDTGSISVILTWEADPDTQLTI
eukprot:scaffold11495_cov30-Tisochrysis_lutea.AAC.3